MADYPINHHILAEDFREQDAGRAGFSQDDAKWLLDSLRTMCNAYDEVVESRSELISFSVCYTPDAIRDSFDSYDDNDPNKQWAEQASDEQLKDVAEMIVGSDPAWSDFHNNIDMCVEAVRTRKE